MYLQYLIQEAAVREEIVNNEANLLQEFKGSFSIDGLYDEIDENLGSFIVSDNLIESYNKIKEYSKTQALMYLTSKSKQLA
jgi:hypothetical protein